MAFKMKNPSMAKMVKAAGDNRTAMKIKMEEKASAAKMKKESAMKLDMEKSKRSSLDRESMAKLTEKASAMKMKKDSAMKKEGESPKLKKAIKNPERLAKKAESLEKKPTMRANRENLKSSKGSGKTTRYTKNPAYVEYEKKRKSHRDRGGDDASFTMEQPPKYIKASERKTGSKSPSKMKKDSAAKFNAKLKAASKAGKLSGKFKEAVDASPAKMKKPMKMKKAAMKMNYKK